jgi:hypothetical protein
MRSGCSWVELIEGIGCGIAMGIKDIFGKLTDY